jgi:phosphatidylserine decarboxylase
MTKFTRKIILIGILSMMMCSLSYAEKFEVNSDCPCYESIKKLEEAYYSKGDAQFKALLDSAFDNMQRLPPEYPNGNPWMGKKFPDLLRFLIDWSTFLPTVDGSHDDGLKYIQKFAWLYYRNQYGVDFVQARRGTRTLFVGRFVIHYDFRTEQI